MSHYRIRRNGIEFPVAGLHALEQLVLEGSLAPEERIWEPEKRSWLPAEQIPSLKESFRRRSELSRGVPAHAGESDAASIPALPPPRAAVAASPALEPASGLSEPPPLGARETRVKDQPSARMSSDVEITVESDDDDPTADAFPKASEGGRVVSPVGSLVGTGGKNGQNGHLSGFSIEPDPPERRTDSEDDERGLVVPFPSSPEKTVEPPKRRKRIQLASTLVPTVGETPAVGPGVATAVPLGGSFAPPSRWWLPRLRVVLPTVVLGSLGLFFVQYYVRETAHQQFGPVSGLASGPVVHSVSGASGHSAKGEAGSRGKLKAGPETVQAVAPLNSAPEAPQGGPSRYDAMFADLNDRMLPGTQDVSGADGLESALLIEFSRLKFNALHVVAPVVAWEGTKAEVPAEVNVEISYTSPNGEIDRELTAIGLVVGKYMQQYDLRVPRLEITIQEAGKPDHKRVIDARDARRLYLRQITVERYLAPPASDESPAEPE
jgi:hypothetical protein